MAKPRTIDFPGYGKIYLQNFKTDVADKLEEIITSLKIDQLSPPTTTAPTTEGSSSSFLESLPSVELDQKAIGIYVDKVNKKASLVIVDYNRETGEAKVSQVKESENVKDAIIKFKMAASEYNFV